MRLRRWRGLALLVATALCLLWWPPPISADDFTTLRPRPGAWPADPSGALALAELRRDGQLSFQRAVELAERYNPGLENARLATERFAITQEIAEAAYASDIELRLAAQSGTEGLINAADRLSDAGIRQDDLLVELRWTLPWWHKEDLRYDGLLAAFDTRIAQARYVARTQDLRLNVLEAFVGVLLAREQMRVARDTLELARSRRDNVAQGFTLGTVSERELVAQNANLRDQEFAFDAAVAALDRNYANLAAQLGILELDRSVALCGDLTSLLPYDPSQNATEDALAEQTAIERLEIAKVLLAMEKARQLWQPRLSLRTFYSRSGENTPFGNGSGDELGVGITLQIPLPNLAQRSAQGRLAAHDLRARDAELARRISATRASAARLTEQIVSSRVTVGVIEQRVRDLRDQVGAVRNSFALGRSTFLEVQVAELNETRAVLDYLSTLADYRVAIARHQRLFGNAAAIDVPCRPG